MAEAMSRFMWGFWRRNCDGERERESGEEESFLYMLAVRDGGVDVRNVSRCEGKCESSCGRELWWKCECEAEDVKVDLDGSTWDRSWTISL
jgi:hypothetical protein